MLAVLSPQHYLGSLRGAPEGAQFNHTARVDFDGHEATAYVKVYPPESGGLVGEALGFLAAVRMGIPRPPHAAIIELNHAQLAGVASPRWLEQLPDPFLAWACEELPGNTLRFFYASQALADDAWRSVLRCKSGPAIAAADEWLANNDRSDRNILRTGKDQWAVIDHGEALGGNCWPLFGPNDPGETQVTTKARTLFNDADWPIMSNRIVAAGAPIEALSQEMQPLLKKLLATLGLQAKEDDLLAFLLARSNQTWLPQRLEQLI